MLSIRIALRVAQLRCRDTHRNDSDRRFEPVRNCAAGQDEKLEAGNGARHSCEEGRNVVANHSTLPHLPAYEAAGKFGDGIELCNLFGREGHIRRCQIILQLHRVLGPDNGG